MSNGKRITLAGGALACNIVWVVTGAITVGPTAHFQGILLGSTGITLVRLHRAHIGILTMVVFWGVEMACGMSQSPGRRADEDVGG